MNTYKFECDMLKKYSNGAFINAWYLDNAPTEELRAAISWNDANGDFEDLNRLEIIQVFMSDFIQT
jgi:hypothetical protein